MKPIKLAIRLVAASILCLVCVSLAQAQATRTWVSGVGDDANPCSRTAPCKTFAGAISKTAAKGEINVLDPGGFGAVTITKAITISSACFEAGVLVSGTNGIVINAGATDDVTLEGLDIEGLGTGLDGVKFLAGRHLHIENCKINQFTQQGIELSMNQATAASLTVNNCRIANNGNVAIRVQNTGAGAVSTQITNTRINFANIGVDVLSGSATVAHMAISNVAAQAVVGETSGTVLNVASCVLNNNGTGISAFNSGVTVNFANCDIYNNGTGVNAAAGSTVNRFQNSRIINNGTNTVGTINPQTNQ